MENLIATVVAVGLISIMAVMGVNYGTDAVLNYQARVDANKIISDAQNIAAAWKIYARANNGDPSFSADNNYCWGSTGAVDLVPAFISTLPLPPKEVADVNFNYYIPAQFREFNLAGTGASMGPAYKPADTIVLWLQNPRVCKAISSLAGQTNSTQSSSLMQNSGVDLDLSRLNLSSPYDCAYNDLDGDGAPSQGDTMLFVYRVFDQNIFTPSARGACPYLAGFL